MKTIKIIIERSGDYYDAYAENCEGVYGAGNTPAEAKENALKGLELLVKSRSFEALPTILRGEYKIIFQYDTQSFLKYYNKIISCAALERISGINQKLLHHYLSGLKKPRATQRK
ncbi:MAG: hypothetical protein LBR45_01110, partial [Bacteroidales bacterium]|nr:hypothetical protein [Bacteroidales bacterium]